jgi:hypothetical protein
MLIMRFMKAVVEQGQAAGQQRGRDQRADQDGGQVDAAGAQCGDLVVLREAAEGHQHGHQHGAGDGEGDDVAQRQEEELGDDQRGDPPVDHEVQVVEQDVHLEDERDHPEPQQQGNQVLLQDVGMEDTHGCAAYLMGRDRGDGIRSGAFDRQGMPC